jgi:hypothetical protein
MQNLMANVVLVLLLVSGSFTATAEIYKWTNDQGEVEYSDQYREGAEKMTIEPISTIQMPKAGPATASPDTEVETDPVQPYSKLAITFPQPDGAFHSGSDSFAVTVELQPDLQPSHSLRLSLDGEPAGVFQGTSFTLTNVERGTHTLNLDVVDNSSVIQSAPPVTFTLHRPTALRPNTPAPK